MPDPADTVHVERVIPAAAHDIFALLADPARHRSFDGSGTVRDPKSSDAPLRLGSTFAMSMKLGVPYSMVSTVVELEPDRRIAWRTKGPTRIGAHVGGRVWRYELEPAPGGATLVRETWDLSGESAFTKPFAKRAANITRKNMAATLERIEQLLTATSTDR